MNLLDLDALALEYQGDYGTAGSELDISDFVDNPLINCVASISGLSFTKKASDIPLREIGTLRDNVPHSFLVT